MRTIIIPVTLTLVLSCQSPLEPEFQIIKVDINDTSVVNISDIATGYTMVQLETSDTCLISEIRSLSKTRDFVFVNDRGNRVLQFNNDGVFIRQIGRKGRGPGEYTTVQSFVTDTFQHYLFVRSSRQILCYDLDGQFINSMSFDYPIESIHYDREGISFLATQHGLDMGNGKYGSVTQLYYLDDQLNIIDSLRLNITLLDTKMFFSIFDMFPLSNTGHGRYFYYPAVMPEEMLRDTLFKLQDNSLIPSIKLDFDIVYSSDQTSRNIYLMKIYRTERYVFSEYNTSKKDYLFCYDLFNQQSYNMRTGFTDNFLNTGIVKLLPLSTARSEFYYVKNGYELEGIVEGIGEDSNPVIIFVRLKE